MKIEWCLKGNLQVVLIQPSVKCVQLYFFFFFEKLGIHVYRLSILIIVYMLSWLAIQKLRLLQKLCKRMLLTLCLAKHTLTVQGCFAGHLWPSAVLLFVYYFICSISSYLSRCQTSLTLPYFNFCLISCKKTKSGRIANVSLVPL